MPTYEYGCRACGHQMEAFQRISEAPLKLCPSCNREELERLISATAFVLKGGGWYKDLYSSKPGKRSENQVTDRLDKAVSDDKKKSDGGGGGGSSTPTPTSSTQAA